MSNHRVRVTVIVSKGGRQVKATQNKVRLNDDDVQAAAAGLAYGLVEEAWGLFPDEGDQ